MSAPGTGEAANWGGFGKCVTHDGQGKAYESDANCTTDADEAKEGEGEGRGGDDQ